MCEWEIKEAVLHSVWMDEGLTLKIDATRSKHDAEGPEQETTASYFWLSVC